MNKRNSATLTKTQRTALLKRARARASASQRQSGNERVYNDSVAPYPANKNEGRNQTRAALSLLPESMVPQIKKFVAGTEGACSRETFNKQETLEFLKRNMQEECPIPCSGLTLRA